MAEVLRKSLLPLLLAGGLAALGGCSSGYHSEAASAPNPSYRGPCTVGPTAGTNQGCDALQDQGEVRSLH